MHDDHYQLPVNLAAERAILSVAMIQPELLNEHPIPEWAFMKPQHAHLYAQMVKKYDEHGGFDLTSLGNQYADLLADLLADSAASVSMYSHHVEEVRALAIARKKVEMLGAASQQIMTSPGIHRSVWDTLHTEAETLDAQYSSTEIPGLFTYEEYEHVATENPKKWVVDGVIREQGRMIVVGGEGKGKSTLLRQIALCTAAGLHPFMRSKTPEPKRVLIVDVENDPSTSIDRQGTVDPASLMGMRHTAQRLRPGVSVDETLHLFCPPHGLDLRSSGDVQMLDAAITRIKPDLVTIGPVYRLYRKSPGDDDESLSAHVQFTLDRLRTRHNFAVLLEHHAAKGAPRDRVAPYGSSLWLRWPDIGMTLIEQGHEGQRFSLERFRGDRYAAHGIPLEIVRGMNTGEDMPWVAQGWMR